MSLKKTFYFLVLPNYFTIFVKSKTKLYEYTFYLKQPNWFINASFRNVRTDKSGDEEKGFSL